MMVVLMSSKDLKKRRQEEFLLSSCSSFKKFFDPFAFRQDTQPAFKVMLTIINIFGTTGLLLFLQRVPTAPRDNDESEYANV